MSVRSALRAGFVLASLPALTAPAFAQTEVTIKDFDDGSGGHQSAIWKDGRPYWYSDYASKATPAKPPSAKKPAAQAKPDAEKSETRSEPSGDERPAEASPGGEAGPSDGASSSPSDSGGGGGDAGAEAPSGSKATAAAASHGRSAARASAGMKGMASALKSLGPGDPGAVGAGARPAAAAAAGGAARPAAASGTEILAASYGGDAAAMARLGLRLGTGPDGRPAILDSSGRLASPAQLEALRRQNPRALERRPDFFGVIPREQYAGLVAARTSPSGASNPAFQDIGMTAGARDFVWSKSCTKGLDSCNPLAAGKDEAHYDKNAEVSPETLKKVADANGRSEDDATAADIDKLYAAMKKTLKEMDRKEAEEARPASSKIMPTARSLVEALGQSADDGAPGVATTGAALAAAAPAPSGGFLFGVARLFRRSSSAPGGASLPGSPDDEPRGRLAPAALLVLAALAAALFAYKRRSSGRS